MGLEPGQGVLSLGTSGVVAVVSTQATHDSTGLVAGFADAAGGFLPLACTLNGARILDVTAQVLGLSLANLDALAATAESGADGLTLVPYFEGERTPNLPHATATLHGMTLTSFTRANLARAAFEGLLCLMADALAAVTHHGIGLERLTLTGGGAKAATVKTLAPGILGVPIALAPDAEYVARGAARQAAWTVNAGAAPPLWSLEMTGAPAADPSTEVLTRYRTLRPYVTD
jgi:xylulokinase